MKNISSPKTWTITKIAILAIGLLSITTAHSHDGEVSVSTQDGKRCFTANGLPDHGTGEFPNQYNPNGIEAQNIRMCVSTTPKKASEPKMHKGSIGIGINGVQFRPGTAGYYDGSDRRGHSRNPESGWKLEGLNPGNILGMDQNNAHVGPNGLYHYHGVVKALTQSAGTGPIAYAADGFPIYYAGNTQTSAYQLKKGTRPSGPGGTYDGTYENDFNYIAGSGSLDQCNGEQVNGEFAYFATETYPFLPRCLWGEVSEDFKNTNHGEEGNQRRKGGQNRAQNTQNRPNQGTEGNRENKGNNSPRPAITACSSLSLNDDCSFNAPRRNIQVTGKCQQAPRNVLACK